MVATGSPKDATNRVHVDVTANEFERRLVAHGHSPAEIHRLWEELSAEPAEAQGSPRVLGLGPVVAVYLGLLLVVAASVSLLAIYWHSLGAGGILALGAAFLAGSLVASEILRRRLLPQAADVLEAVAVGWVGLVAYAAQRLAGIWPRGVSDIHHVPLGLTIIAAAGLGAGLVLLALRADPLLFVPLALACGVLSVDAAELVFGNDLSPRERITFILPVGLAWIVTGLWLDLTGRRVYATWAHWVGLLTAGGAVMVLVPKTVPGFTVVGALGAAALFFSAFVRHWSFTIVGAIGVLLATLSAIGMLHGFAPLVIGVVGLALIFVGLRWSKWRETIRATVLAQMPERVRSVVGRLAP
ncbi:MAG: hypothetical protein ACXVZP_10720 [Gaiellaceae bacterium]